MRQYSMPVPLASEGVALSKAYACIFGGPYRFRTDDLFLDRELLYH